MVFAVTFSGMYRCVVMAVVRMGMVIGAAAARVRVPLAGRAAAVITGCFSAHEMLLSVKV